MCSSMEYRMSDLVQQKLARFTEYLTANHPVELWDEAVHFEPGVGSPNHEVYGARKYLSEDSEKTYTFEIPSLLLLYAQDTRMAVAQYMIETAREAYEMEQYDRVGAALTIAKFALESE